MVKLVEAPPGALIVTFVLSVKVKDQVPNTVLLVKWAGIWTGSLSGLLFGRLVLN